MTIMSRDAAKTWWKKDLPEGVAYVSRNYRHEEWVPTTYRQILDKKIATQQWQLENKRRYATKVAGYVWVFNVDWFLFGGWYIYIKTRKHDYSISFRHERNSALIVKAMQLFPCGVFPDLEFFQTWAAQFAKQYAHKGFKRKRYQGLVKCWCNIDENGRLTDINKTNR